MNMRHLQIITMILISLIMISCAQTLQNKIIDLKSPTVLRLASSVNDTDNAKNIDNDFNKDLNKINKNYKENDKVGSKTIVNITKTINNNSKNTTSEINTEHNGLDTKNNKTNNDTRVNNTNNDNDAFEGTTLTYTEGDIIKLSPVAVDPDGDKVTYTFSSPISKDGIWQTKIGDEGVYFVKVIASDGKLETEGYIKVIISRANRPPVIDCVDKAILKEGERFFVGDYCKITDPDDDKIVVYYGGWPGSSRYTITYNDAGEHTLIIYANDKEHTIQKELPIYVTDINRAPIFNIDFPTLIKATEGDIITLDTNNITDPDGDKITLTFSQPFSSAGVWKTKIGDAGDYDIDVVASDGQKSVKKTIHIVVGMKNTKPILKHIQDIVVNEGDTITLPIVTSDRENDKLAVTISGWMSSDTYTTTYDDAGNYTVTITVSDGSLEVSQLVHITVNNVNRPPRFVNLD